MNSSFFRTTRTIFMLVAAVHLFPLRALALNVEWENAFGSKGQAAGQFGAPVHAAMDASGNYHVTDSRNGRVQVFDKAGMFKQEYGRNSNPKLVRPWGIAISPVTRRIYVADNDLNLLFVFTPDGSLVETLGGKGSDPGFLGGPRGVSVGYGGRVYVADTDNGRISGWGEDGLFLGVFGPESKAGGATLKNPVDVAVDPEENLYVADSDLREVVLFNREWRRLTKVGRERGFDRPVAVAAGRDSTFALMDGSSQRIFHFAPGQKPLQTFGSEGTAQAQFKGSQGLLFDEVNQRFVVIDTDNSRVQLFRHRTREEQAARTPYRPGFTLEYVRSIAYQADDIDVGDGKIFALNSSAKEVRVLTTEGAEVGRISLKWGAKDDMDSPARVLYHAGTVYVSDSGNHDVKMFDPTGVYKGRMGSKGSDPGRLKDPRGMFGDDRFVYVVDRDNERVSLFSPNGGFVTINQSKGSGGLDQPRDLVVDAEGNLYVIDEGINQLMKYSRNSQFLNALCKEGYGAGFIDSPVAIEMDRMENFYILDRNGVQIVDKECRPVARFGAGLDGKGKGRFARPGGLAVDDAKGVHIYFSDPVNRVIQVVAYKQVPSPAVNVRIASAKDGPTLTWEEPKEAYRELWEIQGSARAEGPFARFAEAKASPVKIVYPATGEITHLRLVARSFSGVESAPSPVVTDHFRQAQLFLESRQYDMAVVKADEFLASSPDHPDVLYIKARSLVALSQVPKAAEIYQKLAAIEGFEEAALEELGRIYVMDGKHAEARETATRLLTKNEKSVPGFKLLAEIALATNALDDAVAQSSRAIAIAPEDTEAMDLQAKAYIRKGLGDEAIKIYANAIKVNKTEPRLYLGISSALIATGRASQAVPYLQWVVKTQPKNTEARVLLARALLDAKQPSGAAEQAEEIKKLEPDSAAGYELAGFAARDLKDSPKAIFELEQAARKDPQNPRYQIQLGVLYQAANRPGDANQAFQKAIALTPNTAKERRLLADQLFEAKLYPLATVEYDNVYKLDPKQTDAVLYSAESYFLMNRTEPARNGYLKAIEANPNAALAHYRLGMMHASTKEHDKAVPRFMLAARIDPRQAAYPALLGDSFMVLGDYRSAAEAYQSALQIEPQNEAYQAKHREAKGKYDAAPYELTGPLEISDLSVPDLQQSAFEQYRQNGAFTVKFTNNAPKPVYRVRLRFSIVGYTSYPFEDQITSVEMKETKSLLVKPKLNQAALDLPADTFAIGAFEVDYFFNKKQYSYTLYRSLLLKADLAAKNTPAAAVPGLAR